MATLEKVQPLAIKLPAIKLSYEGACQAKLGVDKIIKAGCYP